MTASSATPPDEDRLDDGERRERDRRDVEQPRRRSRRPCRPRTTSSDHSELRRAQRVLDVDRARLARPAVLVEEREVRRERRRGARAGCRVGGSLSQDERGATGESSVPAAAPPSAPSRPRLDGAVVPGQRSDRTPKSPRRLPHRSHRKSRTMQRKPLLLVDVDGVISLWGFDPDRRPAGAFASVDGIAHFLSQEAGEHLLALADAFELVWCTGWEEKANEYLPHALGLGPWPYLSFDRHEAVGHDDARALEARGDRRLRGRPAAGLDRRRAQRRVPRLGARGAAAPTLLVRDRRRPRGWSPPTRARCARGRTDLQRTSGPGRRRPGRRGRRAPRRSRCRRRHRPAPISSRPRGPR